MVREQSDQGAHMAANKPAANTERRYIAKALIILGLAFLLADLAFLAPSFEPLLDSASHGLSSLIPTVGLSILQAARVILLQQIDYVSIISRILVLFSALALMVIGGILWDRRSTEVAPRDAQIYIVSFGGDN
jgi:hypothetical protein